MKTIFDNVSLSSSKITTKAYSTSFSLGIYCLHKKFRNPIYSIYGFVRFADEIVDSFHDQDKATLLKEFKEDTYKAIERKISLNPILNSLQQVVHLYKIDLSLIDCFLQSMEMDLYKQDHSLKSYNQYILGSAEVVGLMCLHVFMEGDETTYNFFKHAAMKLGAAFQKVNFLRDIQNDYAILGRIYFPHIDMNNFSDTNKQQIEKEIERDFAEAFDGIKQLPASCRFGIYVAYVYYKHLFNKIKSIPSTKILMQRIRIPSYKKIRLLLTSYVRHSFNFL